MRAIAPLTAMVFMLAMSLFAQEELDQPEEVDWHPTMQRISPPHVDGTNNLYHNFGFLRSVSADDSVLTACSMGAGHPVILRSTDFGTTWSVTYDPGYRGYPDLPRDAVSFPNGFACYVFGHGRILISRDAGLTWTDQRLDTLANVYAVDFIDDRNGIIRWGPGGIDLLLTSDGGMTWDSIRTTDVYVHRSSAIVDVAMTDHRHLTIVRNYLDTSWCYVSPDRGTTWSMTQLPSPVLYVQNMGGQRLWGFCNNYLNPGAPGDFRAYDEAWESIDAGISWKRMITALVPPPWGISNAVAIGSDLQIVGGSAGKLYYVDRGRWKVQKAGAFGLPEAAIRNLHRHKENMIFGTIGPDFFRMTYVPSHTSTVKSDHEASSATRMLYVSRGTRLAIGQPFDATTTLHVTAIDGTDAGSHFSVASSEPEVLLIDRATPAGIYAVSIVHGTAVVRRLLLNVR